MVRCVFWKVPWPHVENEQAARVCMLGGETVRRSGCAGRRRSWTAEGWREVMEAEGWRREDGFEHSDSSWGPWGVDEEGRVLGM